MTGALNGTTATFSGVANVNSLNITSSAVGFSLSATAIASTIAWQPGWGIVWTEQSGTTSILVTGGNVALSSDAAGNLVIAGTATKPGGGAWTATSDDRIKTVEGDYQLGLEEVLQLQPISYTFKGNDTATRDGPSLHKFVAEAKRRFVGLVAQEVEPIFPDMVSKNEGWIDGVKVNDLRSLDTGELVFALVNAVKTLASRVAALETA